MYQFKRSVLMYDLFKIQIPIRDEHLRFVEDKNGVTTGAEFDLKTAQSYGVKLAAGSISVEHLTDLNDYCDNLSDMYKAKPVPVAQDLYMPYESIPSHNSTLAFKIYKGGLNYFPFVEIKASPAKLLQGHNVFGSTDVELCIWSLIETFYFAYPDLQEILNWEKAEIGGFDVNKMAHVENSFQARQIIQALTNVSAGQIKPTNGFDTSIMWNSGSHKRTLVAYMKDVELKHEIAKLEADYKRYPKLKLQKRIEILKSDQVQNFAKNAIRFEAKIKKEWLKRRGIPTNLKQFIHYAKNTALPFDQLVFDDSFSKIFETFEGIKVNIFNETEVRNAIDNHFKNQGIVKRTTRTNNLFSFYGLLRAQGYKTVRDNYNKRTWHRKIKELSEVIPKAQLMSLSHSTQNIVPMIRLIKIDFTAQLPTDFVEPLPISEQLKRA